MTIILFCLGVVFSQFYIFDSGTPQPAHYLIAISICLFIFVRRRLILFNKDGHIISFLFGFVLYQTIINLFYFTITGSIDFLMQLIYIVYGFFIFLMTSNLLLLHRNVLNRISFFALIGLLMLFIMPLVGVGSYKFAPRYNAFFNDPNQMAFWVLCISSICLCHYGATGKYFITALIFFVTILLIMFTASRSGLLGFGIMVAGYLHGFVKDFVINFNLKKLFWSAILIGCIYYGLIHSFNKWLEVMLFIMERVDDIDAMTQAEIRGYTRILKYPEYLIFGAGHGMELRFNEKALEIHSTWAGIIFYYGLLGFALFIIFIYSIFKKLNINERLLFAAPLIYSFSTFGLRTPIFWVFLGYFYLVVLYRLKYK